MLVVVQVALALVLLIGSGLMIRTFQALRRVDPGFDPKDALTMRITIPPTAVKDPEAVMRLEQGILENIRAIPGVTSAGITTVIPTEESTGARQVYARDKIYRSVPPLRRLKFISPGLLASMRNRLIAGREFTWTDTYERHPVAMVSENLARELWDDPRSAIGKQINANPKDLWREVIGVVKDEREDGVQLEAPAVAYYPLLMNDFDGQKFGVMRTVSYIVRSKRVGSRSLISDVQHAAWSLNATLPLGTCAHAAGDLRQIARAYLIHAGDAGDRRRDGALDRTGRNLRRDLLLSLPALARDRNSHGVGRPPPRSGALVRRPRLRARAHRRGLRISRRSCSDARPRVATIQRKPARSVNLRRGLSRVADSRSLWQPICQPCARWASTQSKLCVRNRRGASYLSTRLDGDALSLTMDIYSSLLCIEKRRSRCSTNHLRVFKRALPL